MSLCSPCAAEPLGSWSPDFSVRVVTQARGGAGRKQNGLPRQLAGVPMATRALKVCISLAGDRSPQRHRGCREAESGSPPAGWFYKAFSFSPVFLFHARKRKTGCGRLTAAISPRGGARFSVRKTGIPPPSPIGQRPGGRDGNTTLINISNC